jgi:TatD DNase family protein
LQEIVKIVPLDKIVIETDSPFLSPEPLRGLRNEPKNVRIVAEFIAKIRELPFGKLVQITNKNTKELFGIEDD